MEADFTPFKIFVDHVVNAIKDQDWVRRPTPVEPKGPGAGEYCAFHDRMGHCTIDCRSLWRQLRQLVNRGYLKEFILNPGQPSETKVQKEAPEGPQQESQVNQTFIQYWKVNAIFGTS